jgi:glycosyltransferase involved in cell wall biosynthesis
MRFIYHHRTMGRSSQGMHIYSLVQALEAAGHEVTIASPPGVNPRKTAGVMPLSKSERASGIHRIWKAISCQCPQLLFEFFELLYNLLIPLRLLPSFSKWKDASFYERHAYFMFAGVLVAKLRKRKVLLEVNELAGFQRGRGLIMERLARWIDARLFSWADDILCVSSVLAEEAVKRGAARDKVWVVPNAIDPKRFHAASSGKPIRQRFELDGSVVVGHVGSFLCWDHLDELVEVIGRVRQQGANVKLLLVGDGPEMSNIKRKTAELSLSVAVALPGPVPRDEVPAFIDAMDICVLPDSNQFGSPIALFEFMAMGKAVVVPDLGPMQDILVHGENGLLFKHGDYEALSKTIVQLVEDPALRLALGSRGRDTVFQRHTWAANASLVVRLAKGEHPYFTAQTT